VWPADWTGRQIVFRYPYRADPPDRDTGQIQQLATHGWPGDGVPAGQEQWWVAEHGPTATDWWHSVLSGRTIRGQPIPKDLASPPPGIAGRDADRLASFPDDSEVKRNYFGMGAYPMDRGRPENPEPEPLAVYELRTLETRPELAALGRLTMGTWTNIAAIFHGSFVPQAS
jgi:hypothetical protein